MAKNVSGEGLKPHRWRDRWRSGITVGFDANGKQKIRYFYGKTQAEAQAKLNEAKKQRDEGTLRTEKSMNVREWFEHWLEVKRNDVEPRTHEEYGFAIRHVVPRIGKVKIDKLTALQVQKMQLDIRESVSARQAVVSRGVLFNAIGDAMKLGLVPRNVVALVDPVRYQAQEFKIWSAAEIVRFLEFAQRCDYYPLYYTALTTGMRPGELIALHWQDVERDKIIVRRTVSIVGNRLILKENTKTKHGRRTLDLPDDTMRILEASREAAEGPLVFPSRTGNLLGHNNLLRSLELYAGKAEVPVIRMHDLRHTYASMRIADGVDIMTLSRDLGHANPAFTLQRYGHVFDKYRKRDAPSLNRLLGLEEPPPKDEGESNSDRPS